MIKQKILESIQKFEPSNLEKSALNFFASLGYTSEIQLGYNKQDTLDLFKEKYHNDTSRILDRALYDTWDEVIFLFQYTKNEIFQMNDMFTGKKYNPEEYESYIFCAIRLNESNFSNTKLANITREINRLFMAPVMILFVYDNYLTLSIINRRLSKVDTSKDVVDIRKVALIKDISIYCPHRAHIEILSDLSIFNLKERFPIQNFVDLHNSWQSVLSVKELNKRFYRELSAWYFWALSEVKFPNPNNKNKVEKEEINNATNTIRLLTRLIFCWFLKEKKLIPDDIFNKEYLEKQLKGFNIEKSKLYYKAILQNLFFATLNTERNKDLTPNPSPKERGKALPFGEGLGGVRRFLDDKRGPKGESNEYGIKTLYRYKELFKNPDEILKLFANIPFLNGGLFECLDKTETIDGKNKETIIDGFSTTSSKQAIIPDFLFFGKERPLDLTDVYGDKKRSKEKVKGLIHILNNYKFTIAENTPIEEEVALDPELLGKVFENLLASYNPETKTTARKQTGSFYTPREIVNYMVDESLIAYLENYLTPNPSPKERGVERGEALPFGEGLGGVRGYMTSDVKTWEKLKPVARELRKNQTEAEQVLWERIRNKSLGYKFRRQHTIGGFIVDFICLEKKLILEVDGKYHEDQIEYDAERTRYLVSQNYRVLRFKNEEVLNSIENVLEQIKKALSSGEGLGEVLEVNQKLRQLFSYSENKNPFNEEETSILIQAIYNCKILDPACGSGAFPMGVLNRMVDLLKKLDPENSLWKKIQEDYLEDETRIKLEELKKDESTAKKITSLKAQEAALREIQEQKKIELQKAFTKHHPDYARKLYLIENCIYGVDIQPIAVQISKLRFFISLVIEQNLNENEPNLGIISLPNLETKFVAANILIGLESTDGTLGFQSEFKKVEDELREIRSKIFYTRKYSEKKKLQVQEANKRKELEQALLKANIPKTTAHQIASWDPFNAIHSSPFFDTLTMFNFEDGFDIVIGNPPYVDIKALSKEQVRLYFQKFTTTENRINLYSIFIEKGISLLNKFGKLVYINPNSILINESYKKIRKHIINGVEKIIKLPDSIFETAVVETIILITSKNSKYKNILGLYFANNDKVDFNDLDFKKFSRTKWKKDIDCRFNIFSNDKIYNLTSKMEVNSKTIDNYILTSLGITPYDKYKGHSKELIENREYHSSKKLSKKYVPLISGKNIHRFFITNEIEEYLKYGEWLGAPREKKFFQNPKIIVRQIVSGSEQRIISGYSEKPHYFTQIGFSIISKTNNKDELKFFISLLNSCLMSFYHKNKYLDIEKIVFQKILIANCRQLPIPKSPIENPKLQKPLVELVDKILAAKDPSTGSGGGHLADTSKLEAEIDARVFHLYGLTEEEMLTVLDSFPKMSIVEKTEIQNYYRSIAKGTLK